MANYLFEEEKDSFQGAFFQKDVFKEKKQKIKVLETAIAGMNFHIEDDQEYETIQEMKPGTELQLYREAENKYDQWAIAVYYGEEDLLGYITRYKNETIARLMDCGKKFIAIVDNPEEREEVPKQGLAPTERNGIPISVYLVED